ncbi:MAG: flavin reductase family protein [Anaerofustis sp.]
MKKFQPISPEDFSKNPFTAIGKDWMLITAESHGKANTMTAAWGGLGVMWNKNVAFIVVRKNRYTKEFLDQSDTFSLSFLGEEHRKTLGYLGSVSGRDEDKIAKSGLRLAHENSIPYFTEASVVLLCRKLCVQPIDPQGFVSDDIDAKWYSGSDAGNYHDLYIGEITQILKAED